nr:immunoglobulin heavy chain junction region [Mus musculus]MBK4186747.1 immunoglobulin heavy chain junction region [Mus musculus]
CARHGTIYYGNYRYYFDYW